MAKYALLIYSTLMVMVVLYVDHCCQASFNVGEHRGSYKKPVQKQPYRTAKPVVINATANHTATLIFLHGLNGSGYVLQHVIKNLKKPYPYIKAICPTANVIPFTLHEGNPERAWYDLRHIENIYEDRKGIDRITEYIHSFIDEEIKNGIPAHRIILAGFCQGAALALHSAITYPKKLGCVLSFSDWPWIPIKNVTDAIDSPNRNIPILRLYGELLLKKAVEIPDDYQLRAMSFGKDHAINKQELTEISEFIEQHVPEEEFVHWPKYV